MLKPKGILSLEVQSVWNLSSPAWHVFFFTFLIVLSKFDAGSVCFLTIKLIEETLGWLVFSPDSSPVRLID